MHGQLKYVSLVADKLKLVWFIVKGTKKVAIFGNGNIARKMCRKIQTKYQTMNYREIPRVFRGKICPKFTTMAYDEQGIQTKEFITTDIEKGTPYPTLEKYNFISRNYYVSYEGAKNNKVESMQQLLKDRKEYTMTGEL